MDQLAAMRAFVRIVETGNFSRASKALGIPKATLSNLVRNLEAHLKTNLLNRTTRRVVVTTDGALYYERALRLVAEIDELDRSLSQSHTAPSGRLRVEMSAAFADTIVIPAFGDFLARYPAISVDLGVGDRNVDYLAENVDCALRGGQPADRSLIARRVGQVDLIACATPGYLARHGAPRHPSDLEKDYPCVNYFLPPSNRILSLHFQRGAETVEVTARNTLSVNDGRSYVTAVMSGLGIGLLPRFMVGDALAEGRLQTVLPDWSSDSYPLYVVYPPNRHLSNKVRVFVDWTVKLIAEAGLGV